ncbi:MAG: TonB-dependent receptor [Bryobacteraceae bacterium]|jgi:outer membrane receptor protein involved in Fe transport
MYKYVFTSFVFLAACLSAAGVKLIQGTVVDPSGARIDGAQVSVVTPLGVLRSFPAPNGAFECSLPEGSRLVVTAPGFASKSIPAASAAPALEIQLDLAPQVDAVRVAGSVMDVAASEQGGSVTVIPGEEIRERNEPLAIGLLRDAPGMTISQNGPTGALSGLSIRGGGPKYNLVEIDGVPVNAFGGDFDFSHIPSEALDRVEIVRGPQSAVYGPYANSGVVNFVTREPDSPANLDVVAEGGSLGERRFGVSGGGSFAGFGMAASASQMNTDGPVVNSDYRNQNVLVNVTRRFGRQSLTLHGDFDSSENGVPGPWGSDPAHTFTGIDTVSRNKNNFSDYAVRYQADLSSRLRLETFGTLFLNNNGFSSPYPFTTNQDLRVLGGAQAIVRVSRHYTASVGVGGGSEQVRNSYITDAASLTFPVRRRDEAVYVENRFEFGGRLFLTAGVRAEFLRTGSIPSDGFSRPYFPAQTNSSANPKLAAAYSLGGFRFHGSFGTGIRPPYGFDLAYTNNPALKPERTRSFDAGVERRFFRDWLSVDATYFYTRFYDLIVTLGGQLSRLSSFQTDNLANSRAQGTEFSARLRPARWVFVEGSYTWLKTEILSLYGGPGVAQPPFYVGQELIRRPANSGSVTASLRRGKMGANLTGEFRGSLLDVEPAFGATNGLFRNPGFANVGANVNYALGGGVTAYAVLHNALDWHYEEVLGYPSPRLNFAAGMKWNLSRTR